jgi:K+-transporting ATPase KdpF subunit
MKTKFSAAFISLGVVPVHTGEAVSNSSLSYILGGIIALFLLGYLVFTLLYPEKF